ncbi:MAG: lytic transglycosylase domain-containing protein [Spirochaetota bacterium]
MKLRSLFLCILVISSPLYATAQGGATAQDGTPASGNPPAESPPAGTAPLADQSAQLQREQEPSLPAFPDLMPLDEGRGAGHWYYQAKKMETQPRTGGEEALMDFAYRMAFHFGLEAEAKEAGRALAKKAESAGNLPGATETARQWMEYFGPDWDMHLLLYKTRMGQGDPAKALEGLDALAKALPATAKSKAGELSHYRLAARAALGDTAWAAEASALLDRPYLDAWSARSLRLAADSGILEQGKAALARMRADFFERRHEAAATAALEAKDLLLSPGSPRHLISEAGRAFAVAQGAKVSEGAEFFALFFPQAAGAADVEALLGNRPLDERSWIAAYYLARLWSLAGRQADAAVLFLSLASRAPSPGDADSALWYWLDIAMKTIAAGSFGELGSTRTLELAALSEAAGLWKNPAFFDDIIEAYDRELLKAKQWDDAVALFTLLRGRLSPAMETKLLYQSARLLETGRAGMGSAGSLHASPGEYVAAAYEGILANPNAEEYYRSLSAWRLRRVPPFLQAMPDLSAGMSGRESAAAPAGANGSLALFDNYLEYELEDLAASLAARYLGSADKELVVRLAFELSEAGQHNMALRLARDAVSRGMGERYPELYGLVYPKAWNEIVAWGASIPRIPEALAYGLIRSESVFDPKAVSYAGAVGLAQLMPATAAETAKGLKMASYSLTNPEDNVRLGMTYFSYMLDRFGRKPMRAMFAYNAGPGRMTTWNRESGELPDDILLDTLHLAQPRQYAKNIIQATLAYGRIHYGIDPLAMLDYLVDGVSLPAKPAVGEIAVAEPAAAAPAEEMGTGQEGLDQPPDEEDGFPALRGHGEAPE